ncbi:MAG: pilus assembly protein [Pontibacterium sp.]
MNITHLSLKRPFWPLGVGAFAVSLALPSFGDIDQVPLYLENSPVPNILFLMDDSGSMDWEYVPGRNDLPLPNYLWLKWGVLLGDSMNAGLSSSELLYHCEGYNRLAYDPNTTYEPWVGKDADGFTFSDQDPTNARLDPYLSDSSAYPRQRRTALSSNVVDLVGNKLFYTEWSDTDGDGEYDDGECPNTNTYSSNYRFYCESGLVPGCVSITNMSAEQQVNFANWFSYYRKREYVAKSAFSQVISESQDRVGLAMINLVTQTGNTGIEVKDVDDITAPVDTTAQANKLAVLDTLFAVDNDLDGNTPLRTALYRAGNYYEVGVTEYVNDLFGLAATAPTPASPILPEGDGGMCQKNFTVLMTDGYNNVGLAKGVGNTDGDGNTDFDGASYADRASNTLADVAMHYYERDLAPYIQDMSAGSDNDPNPAQHMITYTVGFGVEGSLSSDPTDAEAAFTWPSNNQIDDLRHAAWNGRGKYLSAYNATELSQALKDALEDVQKHISSATTVALNSQRLNTGSKIYQARFTSESWDGELTAYPLNSVTGAVEEEAWAAASLIPEESARNIYSYNSGGLPFTEAEWDAGSFSSTQMAHLNQVDGVTDGKGKERIAYLRGSRADEGGDFRKRETLLGDIINSDPVYSSSENFNYYGVEGTVSVGTEAVDSYYQYLTSTSATGKSGRTPMVYVGANDGMLHAFLGEGDTTEGCVVADSDCEGEEVFAYVPKALYSRLSALTDPEYSHLYYVDAGARVGDAYIDYKDTGSAGFERWGSVLVGLLGGGGAGVFALDVSSPTNFSENDVLWDLDDTDLSELGYTFGKASIVKLENGDWGAVFGNGYESANHKAGLYVVNLADPTDWAFIDTGFDGTSSKPNGLSEPIVVDTDGNKLADTAYAGDVYGNLWKFDLSSSNSSQWKVAYKSGSTSEPLFRACEDDNCASPQPITSKPEVVEHEDGDGSLLVLFGTGRYLEQSDLTSTQEQSFYGIHDAGATVSGRSVLQEQNIISEVYVAEADTDFRITTNYDVDYTSKKGWYMDLDSINYPGERVVSAPIVRGGRVIFTTQTLEENPCAFGGGSWLMELNVYTGGRLEESPFDVNGDDEINTADFITITVTNSDGSTSEVDVPVSGRKSTVGVVSTPAVISTGVNEIKYLSGSTGEIETVLESSGERLGRQSWIQIQ